MKKSFAVRLSLRFMFILTTAVLLLSIGFLLFVRSIVKANQTAQLKQAEKIVYMNGNYDDIPYYITYIVYDLYTQDILETNDPFLPLLKDSGGKAIRHFEKDFFFDGDLDILYYAATHRRIDKTIVCAVALNIENDSFSIIFSKLPLSLLLMGIPVLLLSFLVSLFITKNTISPVVKITKAARSMTIKNLDGQLPLTGRGDEIDELSDTFNELFMHIKTDFERERQFSSDVSHELNTPLTVITGQTNLLLRWGKDNPEQLEKSLIAIKNESKSMHSIIENLLQISRIESRRIVPQLTELKPGELFTRVSEEFAAVAPEVKFELEGGELSLTTDPEMLHQIITVLVSNSVKFAGDKCTVNLSASRGENGELIICESDDGPGISEKTLPHVFERFFRGDEAHTRSAGGSGLGLSIAKTLADALGARISAGKAEPHGALFKIVFETTSV
ncbi:MAG: HAMP domain-containing protein [Treponema sp.]|nr:HAMP domain-containing protein [Treponema sp.]